MPDAGRRLTDWIQKCLAAGELQRCTASCIRQGVEREVWDCRFILAGEDTTAVLTIFKPGDRQTVNTSLPPDQAARKCVLAMSELPDHGIPTPRPLGQATLGAEAAILCEKINEKRWTPELRFAAARILARIHLLQESSLSQSLQDLVRISDARECRTTGGEAPLPKRKTLVHGDYFSANILPVDDGLRIVDWETMAWGDPMWDLGFLVGADRDLPAEEIGETIRAYEQDAPLDREQLTWHQQRWFEYWQRRN